MTYVKAKLALVRDNSYLNSDGSCYKVRKVTITDNCL